MTHPDDIWVYLSTSPLMHLTLTLCAYAFGNYLFRKSGRKAIFNPVLIAVIIIVLILTLTHTNYETYFEGAQFVHFLLGPATVALAIPLYRQFDRVRKSWAAILVSLLAGSLTAALSAILIGWLFGANAGILASIAPKSATAPIAMGISEKIGGLPSLTAALVILTGVLGAVVGPWILDLTGIKRSSARGFAIGLASHGIGTARALQINELAGAFSALAMGLNGLATSLLVPLLFALISNWP